MLRPALHQVNFTSAPTAAFLAAAARAGFDAVELHPFDTGEPLATVARAVRDAGLRVATVNPLPDWFAPGGTTVADAALRLLDAAVAVDAELIVAPSPVFVPPHEARPSPDAVGDAFARLGERVAAVGKRLAFEPVGRSVKRPGGLGAIGDPDEAARVIAATGCAVALVLDSFCLATAGVPLGRRFDAEPRVAGVHLADWNGHDLRRCWPGEGVLDLTGFASARGASDVEAFVSLEVFPADLSVRPFASATRLRRRLEALGCG